MTELVHSLKSPIGRRGKHARAHWNAGLNNRPLSPGRYTTGMEGGRKTKGEAERRFALTIPPAIRDTRRALRMTQMQLANGSDRSQSQLSRIEAGKLEWLTLAEAGRLLDRLGIRMDLALQRPFVAAAPFQQDAAHARVIAYVCRRLEVMGWQVRVEVEIVEGRSRGWIDLLAYHPHHRVVFVVEIKAGLDDLGAAQRQLDWYSRAAIASGRAFGWRFERSVSALLVLATESNDQLIAQNHGLIRQAFPGRAEQLFGWLAEPRPGVPGSAIALVDPRSRRRQWLLPTRLEGRRSALRYASYADYMRKVRSARP